MKHERTITRKRRKQLFVDVFGGKCEICGYNKCINSLTFHHLNPEDKTHQPTKVIYERSYEIAFEELKKCIMVCANCHGELHSENYDYSFKLDGIKSWVNLKCEQCGDIFETKDLDRKYCSEKCVHLSQRVVERPSRDILEKLLGENSWVSIGRMYGVADNTVRKWAKRYGLLGL